MKLKFRADLKDIVIFIIFCIFLLFLIAIAVVNINSLATEGILKGINPFLAFTPEFILPTILFFILALVGIFASCSSYFFERETGFGITTQKKSKADGFTKLMTDKEMKHDYKVEKIIIKDDTYEAGGFPFINDGKNAWVDNGENHSLIMGASGSGKTQAFMFPLIRILARAGESMIVTDPKGELYEGCGKLLEEKGYKILLVNFRDPDEGLGWNPFTYPYALYKEGNIDKSNELLQDLATNILIDPNNRQEPFWENTASNYFTGLALGLFDDAKESEININSINMMAEIGGDRIGASTYEKEYFKSKGELSPAYISASSCVNAPADTKGGIMSTFRTKTRIFSSQENLSEMLSHSDFDIRDIGKEKTAVFLKVHDEKTTYHALATIFVKQVYESLIAVAQTCPGLKLPYRTNFILDEFANFPALKDVESMITASRSRKIRFTFVIQNFSQLTKVYGKEVAETIKGNCGNFVYLMSTELAALEEISKLLGDVKPPKPKKDEPAQPIRPLFTVSDLQALKEGEIIVNRFRSNPFKTKLVYDHKIDWGKKYDKMEYVKRTKQKVQVFDLKGYVAKLKESQGQMPGAMNNPTGMGMKNPFMPFNPIPGMGGAQGGGVPSNLDYYVKRLDEKIAELEKEEALEREKEKNQKSQKEQKEQSVKSKDEIEKEITNILDHKNDSIDNLVDPFLELDDEDEKKTDIKDEIKEEVKPVVNTMPVVDTAHIINDNHNKFEDDIKEIEEETDKNNNTQVIEKPKINVDADSIVVNNKNEDDDFFDDFFGDE